MKRPHSRLELVIEQALFYSRWLLAPFYLGNVVALASVLMVLSRELHEAFAHAGALDPEGGIHLGLSLILLSHASAATWMLVRLASLGMGLSQRQLDLRERLGSRAPGVRLGWNLLGANCCAR